MERATVELDERVACMSKHRARLTMDEREALALLDSSEWIGLDLETSGLSPWKDKIAVVAMSDGQTDAVLHVRGHISERLREFISDPRRNFVTHNGTTFDLPFLHAQGRVDVWSACWYDTLLGEGALLRTGRHSVSKSLRSTLARRLKQDIDKSQQVSRWMNPTLTEEQVEYCRSDTGQLINLSKTQLKLARERSQLCAIETEMAVAPVVVRMICNGLPIDHTATDAYVEEQREAVEAARVRMLEWSGKAATVHSEMAKKEKVAAFNPNSPKQMLEMFARQGVSIKKTDVETLTGVAEWGGLAGEMAETVMTYRHGNKRMEMMSRKWRDEHAVYDKRLGIYRIHARFNQTGTETARFSSTGPNLQQIPADGRKVFGHVPGYVVVAGDYSQIEIRIAAGYARDAAMLAAFREEGDDGDIHTLIAAQLFGVEPHNVTKSLRRKSKAASFTLLFGGGPQMLYSYSKLTGAGLTEHESEEIFRLFFDKFRGLKAMRDRAEQKARYSFSETVRLPTGIERTLLRADGTLRSTTLLNTLVQGTAAAGLKFAMIECDKRGLSEYLCGTVHDELVALVREDEAAEFERELSDAMVVGMREAIGDEVPIKVGIKTGRWWQA